MRTISTKPTHVSTLALLGALGMLASGTAGAIGIDRCDLVPTSSGQAHLIYEDSGDGMATPQTPIPPATEPSLWDYSWTVCNRSNGEGPGGRPGFLAIRDWEIPFDGTGSGHSIFDNDGGVSDIFAPAGWDWAIEAIGDDSDPNGSGWSGDVEWGSLNRSDGTALTHVLHFYTNSFDPENACGSPLICPFGSLSGFGYTGGESGTAVPDQTSWVFLPANVGDPPASIGGIPISGTVTAAPEPASTGLLAAGVGLLGFYGRWRKRGSAGGDAEET